MKNEKFKILRNSIIFDLLGMATSFIPGIGAFLDILWAPYAAKKMQEMYKGNTGKIASWIVFIEEILPMTDFIPTFTLMWIYTYVFAPQKSDKMQPIEVEINE
ncbi:MAG: hypothetical protein K0U54_13420 [Bacteroidetes bacterium]|nr:hypothetical protein [Bacteroidota bacterium]